MTELNGVYDLNTKQNAFLACNCWEYEAGGCSARVLCNPTYTDPTEVVTFVTRQNARGKIKEDGLFLAAVHHRGALYLFADATTSQWVLYYTLANGKFYYSTSLKTLLKESGICRELDLESAKGFLKNGIVFGEGTLVKNVKKLGVCQMLALQNGKIKKKRTKYQTEKAHSEADLLAALRESVERFAEGSETIYMPLSAGYDSNTVLNTLERKPHTVHAFTVGGKSGKNEIPVVEENVKRYSNIVHHKILADETAFSKLPEIVWRLDGYVYERGVFLQYLLAQAVANSGGKALLCGECSDEHQHLLYERERKHRVKEQSLPGEVLNWMLQPYTWGNSVVLKKSALMLNSFGVLGCYPFATKRFTDMAIFFGKKNLSNKQLYIERLKDELPKEVYQNIVHAGGSTSLEAMISPSEVEKMNEAIAQSTIIQKILRERPTYSISLRTEFYERYLEAKGKMGFRMQIEFIKYFLKRVARKLRLRAEKTESLEQTLDTKVKEYYLILFYELFITEKFEELSKTPEILSDF